MLSPRQGTKKTETKERGRPSLSKVTADASRCATDVYNVLGQNTLSPPLAKRAGGSTIWAAENASGRNTCICGFASPAAPLAPSHGPFSVHLSHCPWLCFCLSFVLGCPPPLLRLGTIGENTVGGSGCLGHGGRGGGWAIGRIGRLNNSLGCLENIGIFLNNMKMVRSSVLNKVRKWSVH